jgi:hypothetical protein
MRMIKIIKIYNIASRPTFCQLTHSFQFHYGTACNKELPAKFVKQNEIDFLMEYSFKNQTCTQNS